MEDIDEKTIECVELEDDDIVERIEFDVHVDCPKCGEVYEEYNIDFEEDYICKNEKWKITSPSRIEME